MCALVEEEDRRGVTVIIEWKLQMPQIVQVSLTITSGNGTI
jgi:hypothetical protein